uniref:Uncharacterized protein n=1 Tax=Helianthus annuus TaxID=4232 RepID=A0A251V9N8_HELAN
MPYPPPPFTIISKFHHHHHHPKQLANQHDRHLKRSQIGHRPVHQDPERKPVVELRNPVCREMISRVQVRYWRLEK